MSAASDWGLGLDINPMDGLSGEESLPCDMRKWHALLNVPRLPVHWVLRWRPDVHPRCWLGNPIPSLVCDMCKAVVLEDPPSVGLSCNSCGEHLRLRDCVLSIEPL